MLLYQLLNPFALRTISHNDRFARFRFGQRFHQHRDALERSKARRGENEVAVAIRLILPRWGRRVEYCAGNVSPLQQSILDVFRLREQSPQISREVLSIGAMNQRTA